MMEWKPIEQYDAMKSKPKWCVFYVEANTTNGEHDARFKLSEMLSFTRYFGYRNVTMFCELPPPKL